MTESPRKNILLMKRSLLTGLAFFLPLPVCHTHKTRRERDCSTRLSAGRGEGRRRPHLWCLCPHLFHIL